MRACSKCGLSVGQSATFCPVCGALSDALVDQPDPVRRFPVAAPADAPLTAAEAGEATAAQPAGAVSVTGNGKDGGEGRASLSDISRALRDASTYEKLDSARAAEGYRTAIIAYLEAAEDPLGSADVRKGLLRSFDRLSLVLKREGLNGEALEQAETAEALGLLACRDQGVKGHREALERRLDTLRRAGAAPLSP